MSEVSKGAGPGNASLFRWVAIVTGLLVIAQALLAGRGWFIDYDLIEVHGFVGSGTFLAVIGLAFLAFTGLRSGATDRVDLALALLVGLLVFAQMGLGYGGRDSRVAASLHVPNGVLIAALVSALIARSFPPRAAR